MTRYPDQRSPLIVQVELTEGCNLGCSFCGLCGIREDGTRPWYFMNLDTAAEIASEISRVRWGSRIMFSMHGEPTLNPDFVKIIKTFRLALPYHVLSMTSNGYGLVHEPVTGIGYIREKVRSRLRDLQKAGLNDLILEDYGPHSDRHTVLEHLAYERDRTYEIERVSNYAPLISNDGILPFRVVLPPPVVDSKGQPVRKMCNHCGAAAPLDYSKAKNRCAKPFREMTFRYDGTVCLCSNDYRGQYTIGNIHKTSIGRLWNNELFGAARTMLLAGERSFVPCAGCNAVSPRPERLPDTKGERLDDWPDPNKSTRAFVRRVSHKQEPEASVFLRRWER